MSDLAHIQNWAIVREITDGRATPLFLWIFWVGFFIAICCGVHRYMTQIQEDYSYNLFDPLNIGLHTGIWLIAWLMKICGSFGWESGCVGGGSGPGCPIISSLVLLGLFIIPLHRTHKVVGKLGEAIVINLFQTIAGFLIAGVLMFIMTFNSKSKKNA